MVKASTKSIFPCQIATPAAPAVPLTMKNPIPEARKWNDKLAGEKANATKAITRCKAIGFHEHAEKIAELSASLDKHYNKINELVDKEEKDVEVYRLEMTEAVKVRTKLQRQCAVGNAAVNCESRQRAKEYDEPKVKKHPKGGNEAQGNDEKPTKKGGKKIKKKKEKKVNKDKPEEEEEEGEFDAEDAEDVPSEDQV